MRWINGTLFFLSLNTNHFTELLEVWLWEILAATTKLNPLIKLTHDCSRGGRSQRLKRGEGEEEGRRKNGEEPRVFVHLLSFSPSLLLSFSPEMEAGAVAAAPVAGGAGGAGGAPRQPEFSLTSLLWRLVSFYLIYNFMFGG